jgi:putative ABC transport system ATP-binding protein
MTMEDAPSILRTVGLEKSYDLGRIKVRAVCGIDLAIKKGEFVSIMGPSGCGKSTLLYLIGGMTNPTRGSVFVGDTDITHLSDSERTALRRKRIGFVFQRFNLFPTLSALGNVRLAQEIQGWKDRKEAGERAHELLGWVGLADKDSRRPYELSIGEQQRVAIARALVGMPEILLADEPTGNLDTDNSLQIMRVFESLNEKHDQTILMITHNPEIAARADRTIHMRDGRIVDVEGKS